MLNTKEVYELDITEVIPNRFQPRFKFDEVEINGLAESIKEHGVIQPIIVRKIAEAKYEIIAGERRYKASVLAGKATIPAMVVDLDDKESAEVALIENVQRQNLTPIEEAVSYQKIIQLSGLTQVELADKLGKKQSTISNKLRLLNLSDKVQEALLDEKISERHARSLLKITSHNAQDEILDKIILERMTVRRTDEYIDGFIKENKNPSVFIPEISLEEASIQSASAVEFINQGDEKDLLSFLQTSETPEVSLKIPPVAEEAVNLVTDPIIEEPTELPSLAPVSTSEDEISAANDILENNINPGFVNVDKIEANADDIYKEKPLADINLLMSNNEFETKEVPQVEVNEEPSKQVNRFFTMLEPEEVSEENTESEDNLTPTLEVASEEQAVTDFNTFNPEIINNEEIKDEEITLAQPTNLNIEDFYEETPVKEEAVEDTVEVYENKTINYPADNVIAESIKKEDVLEETFAQEDEKIEFKTIVNTIRACADSIEKLGFKIECEEFDFNDMYQVIFKIDKNER
jgi:ParB family chromosome partitioning protein